MIRYGTGAPVAGASTGGQLTNNTTYYLVARVNYSGGAFTSANMWLNPSLTDDVDTPNGDASLTGFSFANPITHIFFRQAVLDADDILRADEIKIGTAWSDVVPSAGPPLPQVGVSTSPSSYIPVTAQTVTAGNSITVYAVELDGSGNYVANTPATWSPINVTGGIAGSDIVPANGGRSAVFTGHLVGTANLRATPPTGATVYNDSGLITVQAAAASQVRVETQADGSGTVVPAQSVAPGGAGTANGVCDQPGRLRELLGQHLGDLVAAEQDQRRGGWRPVADQRHEFNLHRQSLRDGQHSCHLGGADVGGFRSDHRVARDHLGGRRREPVGLLHGQLDHWQSRGVPRFGRCDL